MTTVKLLGPPDYSAEEQQALIDFVLSLKKSQIQGFLKGVDVSRYSGTKEELRARIQEAIDEGEITYAQVVEFLDSVAPWGKQHVFLYRGPQSDIQEWKDLHYVEGLLKRHRVGRLLNARLPMILPEKLTLSSVTHADGALRVTAVQKREYRDRAPEHDEEKEVNGETIFLKAYKSHLTRTLAVFEWDLNANVAMLQITQLQEDGDYEKLAEQLCRLVKPWLDIKQFSVVDLRPAIARLHEMEKDGHFETRSHVIDYKTLEGRQVSARSSSARSSVSGEAALDNAMDDIRKITVGHLGNFYWLAGQKPGSGSNPGPGNSLIDDVHVIIVGAKSRINFPTPNTEENIRHVLQRVRALS